MKKYEKLDLWTEKRVYLRSTDLLLDMAKQIFSWVKLALFDAFKFYLVQLKFVN